MSRRLLSTFLILGVVVGVPTAAYATDKTLGFTITNSDFVKGQRVPASVSSDFSMPARSNGVFFSDIYGCPSGNAAYNSGLLRDRNFSPDETIVLRNNREYCALQLNVSGVSWPSGTYHFGVAPYYYPEPSGSGIVGTRW